MNKKLAEQLHQLRPEVRAEVEVLRQLRRKLAMNKPLDDHEFRILTGTSRQWALAMQELDDEEF